MYKRQFQPLARPFHLLDRKARRIPVHKAKLRGDLVDLALAHGRLPLRRQRDLLKPVSYTHLDVYKRQIYH